MKVINPLIGLEDFNAMPNPKFIKILIYILVKYIVVYVVFMITTNNYAMLELGNLKTAEDVFLYLWLLLFLPIVSIALFSLPYYFSFKIRNSLLFFFSIISILVLEYFFYVYFNSQKHIDKNGLTLVVVSIVVFYLFFHKHINSYIRPLSSGHFTAANKGFGKMRADE
jgi:hypothetical protein